MWTAMLNAVEKKDGMVHATVTFTSSLGDTPIVKEIFGDNFDKLALKQFVINKLNSLNACEAAFVSISTVPKNTVIDPVNLS